jgi:hypothetical protein
MRLASAPSPRRERVWVSLAVFLLLAGFAALELSRLDHFAWNDDEGVFILTARAAQQGSRLYDEVWFNYLPGFLQLLNAAFAVGGFSLRAARVAVLCCALLASLLVTGLSRSVGSPRSALFTILLLATSPHFLALSSTVMTEVPAIALATGAVWAALCYHRTRHRKWLVLSGLALSASLWVKLMMIPTIVAALLAVWLTERTVQRRLAFAALLVVLVLLPLGAGLQFQNPTGFLRQFGLTYVRSKAAFDLDLADNARTLVRYFLFDKYHLTHLSLLLLGGYGWYTLWRRRSTEALLLGAWFAPVTMVLLLHTPLYRHHLIQLLFPVAVLAGLGLERVVVSLSIHRRPVQLALRFGLLAITAVELVLSSWAGVVTLPDFEVEDVEMGREAIGYIRETTHAGEHVVTDAAIIALEADRPVPPELTNTSRMRIRTGQLTGQQVIDISRSIQPGAIVFWEKKLDSLGDFATWVACRYDLALHLDDRHRIYRPQRPVTYRDIAVPLNVHFGRSILLLGYSLDPRPLEIGASTQVTLYWKAIGVPEGDFRSSVRVVDAEGAMVGQRDSTAQAGLCPTWIWQPGDIISDTHVLDVDRIGAGGPYCLAVSLRDHDGNRLSPFDDAGSHFADDEVTLSMSGVGLKRESEVPTPPQQQTANLGDNVKLLGYDLVADAIQPEESAVLTLYWQCLRPMTTSYTVFTHIVDDTGETRGQSDSIPDAGRRPTVGWLTDEVIADHYTIPLHEAAPPGQYQIEVGMYDWRTGQRLAVSDETGRADAHNRVLLCTPIQVGQP